MDTRWLLGSCCLVLVGIYGVLATKYAERPEVVAYEKALMEQLAKLKLEMNDNPHDVQGQDKMKKAMDSVDHLKPKDMPIQEMIGLMGRVFQKQMGLKMDVKSPESLEEYEKEKKAEQKEKEEKKKEKKKKAKKEKKAKRGPSISKTDEL